jgi:DNA-binding NarL/FixJ family response regulator
LSITASFAETATYPKLTPREADLLRAILDGLSNKEIAARLGISVQTVKNGLGPVFDKYQVSSRLELAIRATKAS